MCGLLGLSHFTQCIKERGHAISVRMAVQYDYRTERFHSHYCREEYAVELHDDRQLLVHSAAVPSDLLRRHGRIHLQLFIVYSLPLVRSCLHHVYSHC